jgi:hypothetical protein
VILTSDKITDLDILFRFLLITHTFDLWKNTGRVRLRISCHQGRLGKFHKQENHIECKILLAHEIIKPVNPEKRQNYG